MQTQTVNRATAEIIYGNFTNAQGATITTGMPVCITTTAASCDGNLAVLPAASNALTFVGVCTSDVADNAVGKYIAYGYAGSVLLYAHGSSVTIAIGTAIGPAGATSNGFSSAGLVDILGPLISLDASTTVSAAKYIRALVKSM